MDNRPSYTADTVAPTETAAEYAARTAPLGADGWPVCVECGASSELQTSDGAWHCDRHFAARLFTESGKPVLLPTGQVER